MGNQNTMSGQPKSGYGRFADQVRSKETGYNNKLYQYQNQLHENSALQSQKDNEWATKIQQTKDNYEQTQTQQEAECDKTIKTKEEIWNQQIKAEETKLQKEIEEKEAIFKQQQEQIQAKAHIIIDENEPKKAILKQQHQHEYKPSLSNGIYGHFVLNQFKLGQHEYSLSNGIYGEKKTDIGIYEKIYRKTKEIDDEYKLIFAPECNIIGCCNKPEIDNKLLDGDMYICKQHRIEMANKIKQSGLDGDVAKDIIHKLTNMKDSQLLAEGQQMVNDDYFLKSYTKLKIRQKHIIKQLLTLKRSQSKYWALKIEYKQIEKTMEFLVLIRKLTNPWGLILAVIVIHAVYHFVCGCTGSKCICDMAKQASANARKRREYEKKNKARLKELSALINNLSTQISDKQTQKSECIKMIKKKEKQYDDKITNLKTKIANLQFDEKKWNTDITNKKTQQTADEAKEEKKWDDIITAKQKEVDDERAGEINKWDGWIKQKVDFQNAVNDINQKMVEAMNKIKDEKDKDNAEIGQLEKDLDDETLDEATWEKKMDRLEKLEDKRAKNAEKLLKIKKDAENMLNEKKDEEKDWENKNKIPPVDIDKMKELKQWKLNSMKGVRDTELETLRTNKDNAMNTLRTKHQGIITGMETDRDNERNDLKIKRDKIEVQLATHKDVGKRELETFKREKQAEAKQLEIEEDELNWTRAKATAEEYCRNTSDGWAAVYIVYDRREYYNFWRKSSYSGSTSETYGCCGNYGICRMEGKYSKGSYAKYGRNDFRFKAEGRSTYWYHSYNGDNWTGTIDGYTVVEV